MRRPTNAQEYKNLKTKRNASINTNLFLKFVIFEYLNIIQMIKNFFLLLSFLVVLITSASAQDNIHYFAEEGTVWSIGAFSAPYQLTNLDFIWMNGTEMVLEEDTEYSHVFYKGNTYPPNEQNSEIVFYAQLFQDSILYLRNTQGESYPVFDYTLEVGETADLYIYDYYAETFSPVNIEVESIENISTLGGTRKSWNIISNGATKWIEGLGNEEGVIYANYNQHGFVGESFFMICAFNDESQIYQNSLFEDCYLTGIEQEIVARVSVYPNPFINKFTLSIPEDNYSVRIYNSFGSIIHEFVSDEPECEIDLSGFSRGIYYLRIETNKGVMPKTIVKI